MTLSRFIEADSSTARGRRIHVSSGPGGALPEPSTMTLGVLGYLNAMVVRRRIASGKTSAVRFPERH
jgi:hypothetical protein